MIRSFAISMCLICAASMLHHSDELASRARGAIERISGELTTLAGRVTETPETTGIAPVPDTPDEVIVFATPELEPATGAAQADDVEMSSGSWNCRPRSCHRPHPHGGCDW